MRELSMFAYSLGFQEAGVLWTVALLGNVRTSSVVLTCSYHTGKFLRPKGVNRKSTFPDEETTYSKIKPKNYGSKKPAPHLKTNDSYIHDFCVPSPDSRAYSGALAKNVSDNCDISRLPIETLSFSPYEHGFNHEMSFEKSSRWFSFYLGFCFLQLCLAGAKGLGVNAAQLETQVAKEFREAVWPTIEDKSIPSVIKPTRGAWYEGTDLRAIADKTKVIKTRFHELAIE